MKRGPKPGKARRVNRGVTPPVGMGDPPAELGELGRGLWVDAVDHLMAIRQPFRVYRHGLRIACQLADSLEEDPALTRVEALRRWLHELQVTPLTTAAQIHEGQSDGIETASETGKAKLLRLIDHRQRQGG